MAVHEIDLGKVQGASHAYNLLDNSMFEVAQAGYGGSHGSGADQRYAADRWLMNGSCTASVADGVLSFSATVANTGVQQRIDVGRIKSGQTYTLAFDSWETGTLNVYIEAFNNNWEQIAGEGIVVEESDWAAHAVTITAPDMESVIMFRVCFYLQSSGTAAHIRSVRLCEGSYTTETLPAYIPKGYAAELAECQRYFEIVPLRVLGYFTNKVYFSERFVPKRIVPTVILDDAQSKNLTTTVELWSGSVNFQTGLLGTAITAGETYYYADMTLSADL